MSEAIEYSTHEYRAKILDLVAKLNDAERERDQSQDKIKNLEGIINSNEAEQKSRFEKLQTIAINGIEAASLILTVITQADTAHWQKKENLRNAIAVLQSVQKRIAKADPFPCPFDDDF
ncbi:hypothetical protein H6F44_07890 [Pseudanabaena sp. FACHB-1277]|uniref:Uncharacterized protein n=1 Tax=Pseudanabaena cinerea FACHB-1277 TaxID=2949581 RepID=A0A926USQ6_9CYAN|nr:hypothetical protein [Pseudanabaena cinerea]MBD2150043.1 hypothetical protein [Pseudanabaena cinerea FACHB-1277]